MKFLFTSYISSPEFHRPDAWLDRIKAYVGILEELAIQHDVISIERINYEGSLLRNGVHYQFINFGKRKVLFPWRMHRFIKKAQPDVVIIHGLCFPMQALQLRMVLDKRVIVIVQHHAEKPALGIRKCIQQIADRYIDAYLFAAHEMGMDWVRKRNILHAKKVHEVMEASSAFHPMDRTEARARTFTQGHPLFLWVGRLDNNKDPLAVLNAFLRFAKHKPEARLYMIYHTTDLLVDIEQLLAKNNLIRNNVVLVGKVDHNDMMYWFNSADFIISGSHYEGAGIAVCEAMSCGCLPILTDIPSFRKMTNQGKCGLLYAAGDSDALLQLLIQACELDRAEERRKVLEQFDKELSFKAIAKRISEIAGSCGRIPD